MARDAASMSERAWNAAYDEAMQWRDWRECDRLLDLRELQPWFDSREPYLPPHPSRWQERRWKFADFIGRWVSGRLGDLIEGKSW